MALRGPLQPASYSVPGPKNITAGRTNAAGPYYGRGRGFTPTLGEEYRIMMKKIVLLLAVLLQLSVLSVPTATADEAPEPTCFPCVR
jgi:hypothetical protein